MDSTNIFLEFKKTCEANPGKACLKVKKGDRYEAVTYAALYEKVSVLRQALIKNGIRPGSRVAILLSNGPYWPIAFFSLMSVQAVAVPVDVQLSPEDIRGILRHSESKMLLTEEKFGASLGEILSGAASVSPLFLDRQDYSTANVVVDSYADQYAFASHKLAALFYTSGTTQEHKAVMLTHKNLLSNYRSIKKVKLWGKDDVIMSLLPLHHTYPFMVTCLAPLLEGATVCFLQTMVPHELFSCLQENKITFFVAVPQLYSLLERSISDRIKKYGALAQWMISRLLDICLGLSALSGCNVSRAVLKEVHNAFGGHLRIMTSGGAKLEARVARAFHRMGFTIIEGYGLTETSPVATFMPLGSVNFKSVGKPLPDVSVKIVDSGNGGEIAIKGDNVMLGYYRALKLTRQVIRDGWFLTGDLGYQDKKGYLYITGRIKELIVLPSGKKISPEEVEAHYLKCPFIKEMCVFIGRSAGEAQHLVAVIVPDEDYFRAKGYININFKIKWELDAFSQKLPPYQRIRGFVLTHEALPRTRLGKIIRYKIEEMYAQGAYKERQEKESAEPEKLSHFEELALRYLSRVLKQDVRLNDHLELDLGLDSLGRIELLSALQDLVNVGIDDSLALELFQARTVKDLIAKARQALPESAFSDLLKREDLVIWPSVLSDPPSQENRRRLKLHFDLFDKTVSFIEVALIKFLFRAVFSLRVKGKINIPKDGPFVITSNHVSFLDAFYLLCALPFRLILKTYFVGFGDIFNHPLLRWSVRFHRLIPIDSNLNLAETMRICHYILKAGKILVYFPEGQRSIDGTLKDFRKGIGILARESEAKILPMYLSGAFEAWPRTRAFPLPAGVTVQIGPCVDEKDLERTPAEDPYLSIARTLKEKTAELASQDVT